MENLVILAWPLFIVVNNVSTVMLAVVIPYLVYFNASFIYSLIGILRTRVSSRFSLPFLMVNSSILVNLYFIERCEISILYILLSIALIVFVALLSYFVGNKIKMFRLIDSGNFILTIIVYIGIGMSVTTTCHSYINMLDLL